MQTFRHLTRPVVYLVLTGFLALTLHLPAAQAGLVGTDVVISAKQSQETRAHLRATLDRTEVKQALLARGVEPDQVQARVDALTDQEAQQLATKMDKLPAGGDPFALAVFVFLILLLTDILGFTDIFPFVKKPAK